MKPPTTPSVIIVAINAAIALGLSIEDIIASSGRLAPVPPIISAIAAPMLMPLAIKT